MIKIYSTNWWGSCVSAKKMLDDMDVSYEEINIEEENISRENLFKLTGGYTVPQIIINNNPIGGYNQLLQINQSGKLKELLNNDWG